MTTTECPHDDCGGCNGRSRLCTACYQPHTDILGEPALTFPTGTEPLTRPDDLPHEVDDATYHRAYVRALTQEFSRAEARRTYARASRPRIELPEVLSLTERLARPREPRKWRIEGWMLEGHRVLLAAQAKAGKTTLAVNAARCLVDGSAWLDRYPVEAIEGNLLVLDFEMGTDQLDDWYERAGILKTDHVIIMPMRGRAQGFDLYDSEVRRTWADLIIDHDIRFVIWDCLSPVITALGLDENHDARGLLQQFDVLLTEVQDRLGDAVSTPIEALVLHHMGHTAERARGDSGMLGWTDGNWRLLLDRDEKGNPIPDGSRYISATVRDADQPEQQLALDKATGRLSTVGGNRADAKRAASASVVVDVLAEAEGRRMNKTEIINASVGQGLGRNAARSALDSLVALRQILTERVEQNAVLHWLNPEFHPSTEAVPEQEEPAG